MITQAAVDSIVTRAGVKPYRRGDRFLGKCWKCESTVVRHRSQLKTTSQWKSIVNVPCRLNGCNALVKIEAVRWTQTQKPHKCDARCEHAKGTKCECECMGENHGALAGL
jgi:hypothetical protein